MPVAACVGRNRNFFFCKLGTFLGFWPIRVVSKQMPFEVGFEKSIKTIDIMAIACNLETESNASLGSKDQMLADAVKPEF